MAQVPSSFSHTEKIIPLALVSKSKFLVFLLLSPRSRPQALSGQLPTLPQPIPDTAVRGVPYAGTQQAKLHMCVHA